MHRPPQAQVRVSRLGERALLVRGADQGLVQWLLGELPGGRAGGHIEDLVPADGSLLVRYDGTDAGERAVRRSLRIAIETSHDRSGQAPRSQYRRRVIPVSYGGVHGPDLEEAAGAAGCTPAELIARHVDREYTVDFLGFAPGFAYLGGLDPMLVGPRLTTPRTSTPAGSVAIAETYTGIYPADLPGGWRVIGWTPLRLFDPSMDPPTYLLPGDTVRFEVTAQAGRSARRYRAEDW